jgi:protein-disulfide isomerase
MADKQAGESLGVKSTPTYFINGEMVVGGRNLVDKLKALLNTESL